MANNKSGAGEALQHADLSARPVSELSEAERAELNRRYENFMRHFRASSLGAAPSAGMARRIRKWHP